MKLMGFVVALVCALNLTDPSAQVRFNGYCYVPNGSYLANPILATVDEVYLGFAYRPTATPSGDTSIGTALITLGEDFDDAAKSDTAQYERRTTRTTVPCHKSLVACLTCLTPKAPMYPSARSSSYARHPS